MYKIINYYELLKKIKNIRFMREDITTKYNKVSKVIKLILASKRSLKHYLYQFDVPKSTFLILFQILSATTIETN